MVTPREILDLVHDVDLQGTDVLGYSVDCV